MARGAQAAPREVVHRTVQVLLLLYAGLAFLVLRLGYLQVIRHGSLWEKALHQRLQPVPIAAARGTIYDRNLNPLAVSLPSEAVYAIPGEVEDPQRAAAALAPLLQQPAVELEARLRSEKRLIWLAYKTTPEVARHIREARLPGIGLIQRPQRFYPQGDLAAQVLGFAGIDNQGLEGLEAYYDRQLAGQAGTLWRERDPRGRAIPDGLERRVEPVDGLDLVLTLDQVIQYLGERELRAAVEASRSEFGMFVAVEPRTGEVLGMATYPGYDPNRFWEYPPERWRNRPVTDAFEPGSTFKIVTGAAALDAGVVALDEVFHFGSSLQRWGGTIREWNRKGFGTQTFVQAVQNSSNTVFAVVGAERLGPERFYRYAVAFGFGSVLGIDFPGEAGGILPRPGSVAHGELLRWANIGFGQGLSATPLQIVMAAATVVNGGTLMRPYLVKEIRRRDGTLVRRVEPQVLRRVLRPETARRYAEVLRSVVAVGSGKPADVPGYRVAGKTGTAQIPGPHGYIDQNMASFVGCAPVDQPRLCAAIFLYKVGATPSWGSLWAAPAFARLIEPALGYLGVPRLAVTPEAADSSGGAPPAVTSARATSGPPSAARVSRQPMPTLAAPDQTRSLPASFAVVPDLRGLSMRDAAAALARAGLALQAEGSGAAVAQSPAAGQRAPVGTPVVVRFLPPGRTLAARP